MARQSVLSEHRKIIPGNLINCDIPNAPRKTTTSPSGVILHKLSNVPQHVSGICGEMHVDNVLPMLHKNIHVYSHGSRAGFIPDDISHQASNSSPRKFAPMSYVHKGGHGMAMARTQCHVVGHVIQNMRAAEHQPQAAAGRGRHKR